jgi:hypothetical protein
MSVTIRDFRITDRVLAESDPDAGDVVFLGSHGDVAAPFVCERKLTGPGGHYLDAVEVVDADGKSIVLKETRFELEGESLETRITTELRGVRFPTPGTYLLQYWVFDEVIGSFPFQVLQQAGAGAGIVDGALDAALKKGTIAWLSMADDDRDPADTGEPVKQPRYNAGHEFPVWFGYEDGQIYVLTGEGEQQIPGLTEADSVRLIARSKDKRSRVADQPCSVAVLPKDAAWEQVARDLLIGRRLNLQGGEAAVDRWKKDCEIVVLTPVPHAS